MVCVVMSCDVSDPSFPASTSHVYCCLLLFDLTVRRRGSSVWCIVARVLSRCDHRMFLDDPEGSCKDF